MANKYIETFEKYIPKIEQSNIVDICGGKRKEKLTKNEIENVIDAFTIINSMIMRSPFITDSQTEEDEDEIIDFMIWFREQYGEYKEVQDELNRNWPNGPFIVRLFCEILDEREFLYLSECKDSLNLKQRRMAKDFAEGIWNIREDRLLSVTSSEGFMTEFFPKYIPGEFLDNRKEKLIGLICYCLLFNGALIVRCEKKKKDDVGAFRFENMHISPVPVEELREMCRHNPDGTVSDKDDIETYVVYDMEKTSLKRKK